MATDSQVIKVAPRVFAVEAVWGLVSNFPDLRAGHMLAPIVLAPTADGRVVTRRAVAKIDSSVKINAAQGLG